MRLSNDNDELEKLLEMAENVSHETDTLRSNITELRLKAIVALILCYAFIALGSLSVMNESFLIQSQKFIEASLSASLFAASIVLFLYSAHFFRKFKDAKRSLEVEIAILSSLIDMVHEYNNNFAYKEMSVLEKAVIEMRLRRIKFSGQSRRT